MNCTPLPTVTCGDLINDSCVIITGTWPTCFSTSQGNCYRQYDFNNAAGTQICTNLASITAINNSILGTGPSPILIPGFTSSCSTVAAQSINAAIQSLYNQVCALQTNLNLPITGLSLGCLQSPCPPTQIGTLGQLLQAIINLVCAETAPLEYQVLLSQAGTSVPTVIDLNNTLDPSNVNLAWARTGTGVYTLTASGGLAGVFGTPNKIYIQVGPLQAFNNQLIYTITNANTITFQTGVASTVMNSDSVLVATSLLIKIF